MNDGPRPTPWWARPRVVIPAVVAVTALAALFAPAPVGPRSGDPRLSTLSPGPLGARLLYDLAERLDWETERRLTPELVADPTRIHALMDPAVAIRGSEAHALLEHVRKGGAALVVIGPGTRPFLDSLKLRLSYVGSPIVLIEPDEAHCEGREMPRALALWSGARPVMYSLAWEARPPKGVRQFVRAEAPAASPQSGGRVPTVLGFPLGAGRIVIAADPDVYRTDAMRDCTTGLDVAAVRALEYLRDGGSEPRRRLVFDEFHQGYGAHPGTISAVMLYLGNSPSGRLLTQLAFAGLVLLAALAPRLVPPRPDRRLERRSPLEQVDALARAYTQVGATRTVAERLLRGLRQRVGRGGRLSRHGQGHALDDAEWLRAVGTKHPALAADVALVTRAIDTRLSPRELPTLGPALHRIESTLTPAS